MPSEKQDAGLIRFAEWFRKNYPGPDTIIHKPDWHAPKIYRAALTAAEQAEPAPTARSGAVKVKAGDILKEAWSEFGGNHQTAEFWQDFNEGVTFTLKYLAALEPAEPATDVEPVDHQWRPLEDGKPNFDWMRINEGGKPGWEILAKRNPGKYAIETRPLYARPPESRLREADEGLVKFAKEMCRVGFEGGSIDGCDILDTAVEHGLCKITEYSCDMTKVANAEYLEEGDAIYVFTGPLAQGADDERA